MKVSLWDSGISRQPNQRVASRAGGNLHPQAPPAQIAMLHGSVNLLQSKKEEKNMRERLKSTGTNANRNREENADGA